MDITHVSTTELPSVVVGFGSSAGGRWGVGPLAGNFKYDTIQTLTINGVMEPTFPLMPRMLRGHVLMSYDRFIVLISPVSSRHFTRPQIFLICSVNLPLL
ncbi:hypothetical protein ACFX13_031974 [Malus domestica]